MSLYQELQIILQNLKTTKPQTLYADDALTEDNWNRVVSSIDFLTDAITKFNGASPERPPLCFAYFRLPGMQVPWQVYPLTLQEDWYKAHDKYAGSALRLAGGNASTFQTQSDTVTYDSLLKGQGGAQKDALQQHTHSYNRRYDDQRQGAGWWRASGTGLGGYQTSGVNGARHDTETRMQNITVELYIYKRR